MAQRLTTSFVSTNKPGAYYEQKVRSVPVGASVSGNIVIIGEADGGKYFGDEVLKDNFFTPDQLSQVISKYTNGPIVEAFKAISSPSNDSDITGSANRIYIAKTNNGVKAQATVPTAYGTLKDKNYGTGGNKFFYQITNLEDEVAPSVEGDTISAFGAALTGVKFKVRVNGGAETTVDVLTSVDPLDYDTIGEVIALIDAGLPVGLSCVAGTNSNSIKIEFDSDANANSKGYGKSFEIIEGDVGDLLALGLEEGIYSSSQEPKIQVDVKRTDINLNESFIVDSDICMSIGYVGTTASMVINSTNLNTTVTGGVGGNLSLKLSDFATMKDLSDFINSQSGYSCILSLGVNQLPTSVLDKGTFGICSTGDFEAGRIKKANYNFKTKLGQSNGVDFESTVSAGLPSEMGNVAYLTGGLKGSTTAANVVNSLDACKTINVNFVVPLFSRNASFDIADGLTESGSTYSISSINAAVKSHVLEMSTAKVKKHRQAFLSYWDNTFSGAQSEASSLSNARIAVCIQKSSQVDVFGNTKLYFPWHTACIAAGMQAAGFYKSITNKFANIISFVDPSGFDSGSFGDVETALDSGLLILEKAVVGSKWVSDQTTYGIDTNFVYNSIQTMYASDLVALDLTDSFQTAYSGKSLADVSASAALGFLASKMSAYKQQKLIAGSDDAPNGYLNASIKIQGPIMYLSVEIKIASTLYFIPISIDISQTQSIG